MWEKVLDTLNIHVLYSPFFFVSISACIQHKINILYKKGLFVKNLST